MNGILSRSLTRIEQLLWGLFFVYLAASFILFVYRLFAIIPYPFELAQGEGFQLLEAIKIAAGKQLYCDINSRPYLVCNYPPFYQLLCAGWIALSGTKSFIFGRLLSSAASLGTGFLIFLIVWKSSRSKLSALLAFLTFYSFWYVYDWAPYHRVDMLGIFLGLIGIYLVQEYAGTKYIYPAILFFVLSFYTKQSLIFAPLSAVFYLFAIEDKGALPFLILLTLLTLVVFLILVWVTNGQFCKHMLLSFGGSFDVRRSFDWLVNFIKSYPLFVLLTMYGIYKTVHIRKINAYALYTLFSVVPMLGVGKYGAYANYYLEICIGIAILSGWVWKEVLTYPKTSARVSILVLACLQLNNLTAIEFNGRNLLLSRKPGWSYLPSAADYINGNALVKTIKNIEGQGFCESESIYTILAGKEIEYHPFLPVYCPLWNPENFVQDIKQGRYTFFIIKLYNEITINPVHFLRYYKLKEKIGQYYVFVRK